MPKYNSLQRFWRPPGDAFEVIGSALRAHWRAASKLRPSFPMFSGSASWLKVDLEPGLTTVPVAASSSDRRRDLRRY